MSQNLIKFDGGTWLARTVPDEDPQIPVSEDKKFDYATDLMSRGIGPKGIVAVLNARGKKDPHGPDYRYEWLLDKGNKEKKIKVIDDGRAFYVPSKELIVLKGQEVWTPEAGLIFYGSPYYKNINQKSAEGALDEAYELGCICGISNARKKIDLIEILDYGKLWDSLDFVATYRGTRMGLGNPNKNEEKFYNLYSKVNTWGAVAMSKGYNVKGAFGKPTVGACYTKIPEIDIEGNFIENLREEIRQTDLSAIVKGAVHSGVFTHGVNMVLDKFVRGYKNTVMRD